MKIGSSLALIGVGAILAFAVTGNPSFFNLHTAGWVLMVIGVIGLLLPSRTAGWLGRRILVRRTYPGGRVQRVSVPPYAARNPGTSALEAGLPPRPVLLDEDDDLIEESDAGYTQVQETEVPLYQHGTGQPGNGHVPPDPRRPAATEVIEDLYEQP
jgi:hypothetical protein